MALYKCIVINNEGKKIKLKHISETKDEVINFLKQNNYIIIDIKSCDGLLYLNIDFNKKIKNKDLSVFCKQISTMLNAGVTIVSSLEIIKMQTENKKLYKIINMMYEALQKGNTFSEALLQNIEAFPFILINMVKAGEISGNLEVIMERLSVYFEKEDKIENKVKSAMIYPIMLAVVCTVVVIFLLLTVMPTFVGLYKDSGVPLPVITSMLINISNIIKRYWLVFLVFVSIYIFVISILCERPKCKYKVDYIKLKMPICKNAMIKIVISKFTRTLAILIRSGISMIESLEIASLITGNLYIRNKIMEVGEDVKKGISLSQSLKQKKIFPPMVHSMIKIGEDSGSIEVILEKTADFYDEEVETLITKLTTMLEPAMIVFMALIIGFVVIAMVVPMFDMVKTVR